MRIIEDDIQKVVDKMKSLSNRTDIYYMYGHPVEVNNRLNLMDGSPAMSQKKYPLVALRLDNPTPTDGNIFSYNLNIVIMTYTNKSYNSHQRQEQVFKLKLYPLYELFFEALKASRLFMWPVTLNGKGTLEKPPHTRIDRYFWGTNAANGNAKYIFTDPLDAIEIVDLKINSRDKKC